jgi:two-component system CheB/CheR fusion protein
VVLSGLGNDGSRGVRTIREHGGLTIAQGGDSGAPQHGEMPRAAMATGAVDFVLPVEKIPNALIEHARHLSKLEKNGRKITAKAESVFQKLFDMLQSRVGHDFKNYKRSTFGRRVQRRMQVVRANSVDEYLKHCADDPTEIEKLFDDACVHLARFVHLLDARTQFAFGKLAHAVAKHLLVFGQRGQRAR